MAAVIRESRAMWHPSGLRRPGLRKHSVALFLGAMVTMLVTLPFFSRISGGDILESLAITFVLLAAVPAVGAHRRTLILALLLVGPALVARWMNHTHPEQMPPAVFLCGGLVFMTFVTVNLFEFIARAPRVNSEVLCAGISVYLLLGLLWSLAYTLVASLDSGAFFFATPPVPGAISPVMRGETAIYFSFITLNTVGYGDITPVSGFARILAVLESTTGLFYMALLVARLVSLYNAQPLVVHDVKHGEQPPQVKM
ncbi:MAG: two pore domain potassium channel family protein [Phycisphaerales bacterium]|nr:two pore domain potassium channel family protein [Phycisphaerales bacterium]